MAGIPGRRFLGGVVAFSSALALGAVLVPPAQAAQGGDRGARAGEINVIASHSGRCVEVADSAVVVGAAIVQADCTGQAGAEWLLEESASGGGAVNIVNANSGRCVEVQGTAVGSPARQADCSGQPGMSFRLVDRGTHVWLQPLSTSPPRCLEIDSGWHAAGAPVLLAECSGQSGTGFHQRLARAGNDPSLEPSNSVQRMNVTPAGDQIPGGLGATGERHSGVSADGRYVVFESTAADLAPGDTNAVSDVFVRDRKTGVTERVSVSSTGAQGDKASTRPVVSEDGRYIAFVSEATALVAGDANKAADVFVRDRKSGLTEVVSRSATGVVGTGASTEPSISADGRYVSFTSAAANLVPGDTNGDADVFLRDRGAGTVERVSRAADGAQATWPSAKSAVSPNGRFVVFESMAALDGGWYGWPPTSNIFVRDRQLGDTDLASVSVKSAPFTQYGGDKGSHAPSISADGRFVAFLSAATDLLPAGAGADTNGVNDLYVRDRQALATERISVNPDGSQALAASLGPTISADGRYVSFTSAADSLVPYDINGAEDAFVRDRQTRTTVRAAVNDDGVQGNGRADRAEISANGAFVLFSSAATNMVSGDTNGAPDLFIRPLPRS